MPQGTKAAATLGLIERLNHVQAINEWACRERCKISAVTS
jgi:hypothetical protein